MPSGGGNKAENGHLKYALQRFHSRQLHIGQTDRQSLELCGSSQGCHLISELSRFGPGLHLRARRLLCGTPSGLA